jgi:hypothetical protein
MEAVVVGRRSYHKVLMDGWLEKKILVETFGVVLEI